RPGGAGVTWLARSSSSSVVSPIAETTTTTWLPARLVATMRLATRLMPSASATEEPPYFCTTRAIGRVAPNWLCATAVEFSLAAARPPIDFLPRPRPLIFRGTALLPGKSHITRQAADGPRRPGRG